MSTTTSGRYRPGIRAAGIMMTGYYRCTLPSALVLSGLGSFIALIYGATAVVGRFVFGLSGWPPAIVEPIPFALATMITVAIIYVVLPAAFAAYGLLRGVPRF